MLAVSSAMSAAPARRLSLALLSLAGGALAQDAPDPHAARVTPIVAVVQRTGPAVVNLCLDEEPASGAGGPSRARGEGESLGSGLMIDPDGYILTDAYALPRRTGGLRVRLRDGRSLPATLVNFDLASGLALLKVAAEPGAPFAVARLGTSSEVMVGETVISIGNLQGLVTSVSSGIVSAVGRNLQPAAPGLDFIQIDAPADPGHSGGPVLNVAGEVIGIMHVERGSASRSLAIPVDRVRRSLATRLLDPCLFGELVTGFEPAAGPGGRGVVVGSVTPGGPAERAGLQAGDQLLEVGGGPVAWELDVNKALLSSPADEAIPVCVERGDERLTLELRAERAESPLLHVWRRIGLQTVDHDSYKGVRVARVDPTGPAGLLGLRPGDLIDGLDERLLDTTEDLFDTVQGLPSGTQLVIHVWRGRGAWAGPLILR
jgi:serine protease Do